MLEKLTWDFIVFSVYLFCINLYNMLKVGIKGGGSLEIERE